MKTIRLIKQKNTILEDHTKATITALETTIKRIMLDKKEHRTETQNRVLERMHKLLAIKQAEVIVEGSHYEGDF